MSKSIVRLLVLAVLSVFTVSAAARAQSAQALIRETAKTMGGIAALRAIINQVVVSEGKQFDSSSTPRPLGPTRQISTFRSSLTRDLTQPRIRLEWESRNSARGETIRFVEVIDGSAGLLQEGEAKTAKQTRLHPGRLATRLREEKRAPVNLILAATANKTLQRLADAELNGVKYQVVSFKDGDDKLSPDEVQGLIRPHFAKLDTNKDGLLDLEELKAVATWLNTHHAPGVPAKPKK